MMEREQDHYHTFRLTGQDSQGFEYLEMRVNADASIDTMLRTFECYLKAAGFNFEGQVELTED
tara:strand:+ start:505 stop:693 length:189 start_codon:yes stop_codon:yes gene_type:complete